MSVSDLRFWLLLGTGFAGFALLPQRFRVPWLLLVSLCFLGLERPSDLIWSAAVAAVAMGAPRLQVPRGLTIACLVGLLVVGRYGDIVGLHDVAGPAGLSFLVFTAIALVVDGERRGVPAELLHLVWYPKMLAGPIERAGALVPQFATMAPHPLLAREGVFFLLSGLVKKLVVADALSPVVALAYQSPAHVAPFDLLVATYLFPVQLYADFSGYSDIAVGLSALFGLRLVQNFDRPFLAVTVSEFWSARWHISLGHWFRDYVYVPLGGSRRGQVRRLANLMLVFLLSGLWHAGLGLGVGWGFLVWGAANGLIVMAETLLPTPKARISRILRGLLTFHLLLVTWVFFRAASVEDACAVLYRAPQGLAVFGQNPSGVIDRIAIGTVGLAAGFVALDCLRGQVRIAERIAQAPWPFRWATLLWGEVLLLTLGHWQGAGFIYAGF